MQTRQLGRSGLNGLDRRPGLHGHEPCLPAAAGQGRDGEAAARRGRPRRHVLAWVLAQQRWIVPIPGTTKLYRLEQNIGAASIELIDGDLRDIGAAAASIPVQGARYPQRWQSSLNR